MELHIKLEVALDPFNLRHYLKDNVFLPKLNALPIAQKGKCVTEAVWPIG